MDKDFYTSEKCTSCSMCEKLCPVNNIELKENKVTWKNNCEFCMKCINICPEKAIDYKKGVKDKGYFNINVKDLNI